MNIFLTRFTVLETYRDSFPVLLQLVGLHDAKGVVLDRERVVHDASDVVVEDPPEGRVQLGIDALDIVQVNGLVEEHLVERRREAAVDVVAVEDGNGNDAANEIKVAQVIFVHGRVGINLRRRKEECLL